MCAACANADGWLPAKPVTTLACAHRAVPTSTACWPGIMTPLPAHAQGLAGRLACSSLVIVGPLRAERHLPVPPGCLEWLRLEPGCALRARVHRWAAMRGRSRRRRRRA